MERMGPLGKFILLLKFRINNHSKILRIKKYIIQVKRKFISNFQSFCDGRSLMTPMVPLKSRLSGAIKGKFETIRFMDIVQPLLFFS